MIIDSHQHVMLPTEKQISIMDEAGIDKVILFATSIHPENAQDMVSFKKEINTLQIIISGGTSSDELRASKIIEELKLVVSNNSSRFLGFGPVPLTLSYEDTEKWLNDKIIGNNFYGLGEFTLVPGEVKKLENIFKVSASLKNLPLWVHTFNPMTLNDIKDLADLARKYPSVPVIFGHLGGSNWLDTISLAKDISNIYLDLSAVFSTLAQSIAIKELPERTLFSSDAPYNDPILGIRAIEYLVKDKFIRQLVLGENILRLLS